MVSSLVDRLPRGRTLPCEVWLARHRLMVRLVWLHVAGLLVFGLARGLSVPHALLDVAPIAVLGGLASFPRFSTRVRAAAVALALLTSSAILVHLWEGAIEAHFHFFVMVTLLATYEEWFPYLLAIGYVVLHHGAAGVLGADTVYAHAAGQADPWLWAGVHGAFITALAAVNIMSWRLNEDVRESMRRSERQLDYQAHHDPLTGLPNRKLFAERLRQTLQTTTAPRVPAVLFVDVDNFKLVNDSLGHTVGDRLLAALAERMRLVLRPDDMIARFGGDEFAVLVPGVLDENDVRKVSERLAGCLRAPVVIEGEQRFITASIGACLGSTDPEAPSDAAGLLRDADAAMYRAKELGKARCEIFDDSLREQVVERVAFEGALRGAAERGELRLDYQPVIDLRGGGIRGVEALLRWDHPKLGTVPPLRFVPVAEQSGLIVEIGAWVLRTACAQAAAWPGELEIAVNVSPRQLADPGFPEAVSRALAEAGLPPRRLCLEVTESGIVADLDTATRSLSRLRGLGVRLAIDDFGTGYASLGQLKSLPPVDVLKVDRSFVSGVLDDDQDRAIVDAIIKLAASLGLETISEGVETGEQADQLRDMNCALAQGYHFARPVSPAAITELLERESLGELAA